MPTTNPPSRRRHHRHRRRHSRKPGPRRGSPRTPKAPKTPLPELEAAYQERLLQLKADKSKTPEDHQALVGEYIETHRVAPGLDGQLAPIHSAIKRPEGMYLTKAVGSLDARKCLEVGMAFGTSAFYLTRAMGPEGHLYSVDPFQSTQWEGRGVGLLKQLGLSKRHTLLEEKSYVALPKLLTKHAGTFDLVFIDGWHTFDYTLVDAFYANELLRVGGYLVIDDAQHPGVAKCVRYIETNYGGFYKRLATHRTIAAFCKTAEDTREWNFHAGF